MAYTPTTSGGGASTATAANPFSNSAPTTDFQVVTGAAPLQVHNAFGDPQAPGKPAPTSSATSMLGDLASMSVGDLAALQDKLIAAGFLAKNNRSGIPDGPTRAAYTELLATTSRMNAAGQMVTPNDVLDQALQTAASAPGATGQYATDLHSYSPTDPARIRLTAEAAFQTAVGKKPTKEQLDKFVAHFATEEMNAQATQFNAQDQAKATSLGVSGTSAPASTGNPGIPGADWTLTQQIAAKYGVDPKLLVAIGQHETGWGKLGDGKNGNVLGVGSYDSGSTYKWAGLKNQLTEGAKLLAQHGVYSVDDVAAGKAKFWATDPKWAQGVVSVYQTFGADPAASGSEMLDGKPVGGTIAERLKALMAAAPGRITVNSGTRSRAEQTKLYNDYKAGKGSTAAVPGTSKHEKGLAADLHFADDATRQWAHANAARFGLTFPLANEPWHAEPIGTIVAATAGTQPLSQSVIVDQPDLTAQAAEYAQNADPTETQAYGIGQQFDNFVSILKQGVI